MVSTSVIRQKVSCEERFILICKTVREIFNPVLMLTGAFRYDNAEVRNRLHG